MNLRTCVKGGDSDGRPGWRIQFDYEPKIVERLKAAVYHQDRTWDPETKTWWISENYEDVLEGLFGNFYALAKCQGTLF